MVIESFQWYVMSTNNRIAIALIISSKKEENNLKQEAVVLLNTIEPPHFFYDKIFSDHHEHSKAIKTEITTGGRKQS
jgi:hypothetical protein